MPVVRVAHRRGRIDRVNVDFATDTLTDVLRRLHEAVGLQCGVDEMVASTSNSNLHNVPFESVVPAEHAPESRTATLASLGCRNGAFVYVNYPDSAFPPAPAPAPAPTPAPAPGPAAAPAASPVGGDAPTLAPGGDGGSGGVGDLLPPPRQRRDIHSFADFLRDAEARQAIVFSVVLPTGEVKSDLEIRESATVGQLKTLIATQFGLARDQLGLREPNRPSSAVNMFGNDNAKLQNDPAGPNWTGSSRYGPRIEAFLSAPDASGAPGGSARSSAPAPAITSWGGPTASPTGSSPVPLGGGDGHRVVDDLHASTGGAGGGGAGGSGAGGGGAGGGGAGGSGAGGGGWGGVAAVPPPTYPTHPEGRGLPSPAGGAGFGGPAAGGAAGGELGPRLTPGAPRSLGTELSGSTAPAIVFQRMADVRRVHINMDSFLNQHLQNRRVAWLYGTVDGDCEDVRVEVIYEPPQLGFKNRFLLLEDPHQEQVDGIVRRLGFQKVGWLITTPYRGSYDNILSNTEVLIAAENQAREKAFVTVLFGFEKQDEPGRIGARTFRSTQAFQVSRQAVQLFRAGQLEALPTEDPFVIRTKDPVVATDPSSMTSEVKETRRFHTSYLISNMGIVAYPADRMRLRSTFPVANRRNQFGEPITYDFETYREAVFRIPTFSVAAELFHDDQFLQFSILDRISDFQFLLFLATQRHRFGDLLAERVSEVALLTDIPRPHEPVEVNWSADEIDDLCDIVARQDRTRAGHYRFKLMATFDEGFIDPVLEASEIEDIRKTLRDFVRHIHRVHPSTHRAVVNPLRAARESTRSPARTTTDLMRDIRALLTDSVVDELLREGGPSST